MNNTFEQTDLIKMKQNGYALGFLKEQTPEICLAAVKQNEDDLLYVNENMDKSNN